MFWGRPKTLEELRVEAAKGDGTCTQRIYFPGGGYGDCKEWPLTGSSYCMMHQRGMNARILGVFERLPGPPEPIVKIREDIDASGTDEWSDGRFRTRRGQYARGGSALKMTPEAIRWRRNKRRYRARKRKERLEKQRKEAVESAACPHCRQLHDENTGHVVP